MSGISSIGTAIRGITSQALRRPDPAEMFKKVDSDGNGGISQSELDAMAGEIEAKTGKTLDMSEAVTTYDLNGDGLLGQDEMETMMMALKEILGPPPPPNSGTSPAEAAAAYEANNSEEEEEVAISEAPPSSPGKMFNSLDTDQDGVISEEELQDLFDDISASNGETLAAAEIIGTYDRNGDGTLSREEMETMMQETGGPAGTPPPADPAPSSEEVAAVYRRNSVNTETLATLLDLADDAGGSITDVLL